MNTIGRWTIALLLIALSWAAGGRLSAADGPAGEIVTIRSDNGDNGDVQHYPLGSRVGVVLSPPAEYFPLKLSAVQFQVPNGELRAQVSIHALEGGRPGALLAQSPVLAFGTAFGWLTLDLSAANLVLDTPQPFLVTVEGSLGGLHSGDAGLFLYHDTTTNLPSGMAYYWQDGQWLDHASQWAAPAQVGCPMIRAKVELAPPATPSPTPTVSGLIVLQQGVEGYQGAEEVEISSWYPEWGTYGPWGGGTMQVRADDQIASLVRFDLSRLPAGAEIDQATLSLYAVSQYGPRETVVGAYEVARPWRQGYASWNCADRTGVPIACVPWSAPGCNGVPADRAGTPEDEAAMLEVERWYELEITQMARHWASDPAANRGLALKAYGESAAIWLANSYHGGIALRPKLTIRYHGGTVVTPSPTPTATATPATHEKVLQQGVSGYAGCRDVGIASWYPNDNLEGGTNDTIELRATDQFAGLYRFELAGVLPAEAQITRAWLMLYAVGQAGTAWIPVRAFEVNRAWAPGEVTWNHAAASTAWSTAGCNAVPADRAGTAESEVTIGGINRWYEWDITGMAQGWWADAGSNRGLILKALGSTATNRKVVATEHGSVALRPKLVVRYTLPGAPTPTATPSATATATCTSTTTTTTTQTRTATATQTRTATPTPTRTSTATTTATEAPTSTASPSLTCTPTPRVIWLPLLLK